MKQITPNYYKNFTCIASECRDNCCTFGWQIDLDEDTVNYYKSLNTDFGKKLQESIDFTDTYCMKLQDGKCPFLNEAGLCNVYKELGPEHMGFVCGEFPRFSEYYGNIKEKGIGIACEEAARIIISEDYANSFDEINIPEKTYKDSEFDEKLCDIIKDFRTKLFTAIDVGMDLKSILTSAVNGSYALQEYINNNDYKGMKKYLKTFEITACPETEKTSASNIITDIWNSYGQIEALNDEWDTAYAEVMEKLHNENSDYDSRSKQFNNLNYETKQYTRLVAYYFYRYMLKACYDHDLFGKVRLAVGNLVILRDMDILSFISTGTFDMANRLNNIHIFSREIEYCEDNLEVLYEEFIFGDTFSKDNLFKVINYIL